MVNVPQPEPRRSPARGGEEGELRLPREREAVRPRVARAAVGGLVDGLRGGGHVGRVTWVGSRGWGSRGWGHMGSCERCAPHDAVCGAPLTARGV
eukprot:6593065-Prymnesium_polylepis.1